MFRTGKNGGYPMNTQKFCSTLWLPTGFVMTTTNWIRSAFYISCILFICLWDPTCSFEKVIVPAVYKEWTGSGGAPAWASDPAIAEKYNYSVFLYQKLNSSSSNYFGFNRGAECGTYLRYIVDHYHNFPDVAVFLHAKPHEHQPKFLEMIGCISPNATWYHLNYKASPWVTRSPTYWRHHGSSPHTEVELWTEQCWRDTLQAAWGLRYDDEEFRRRVPSDRDIWVSLPCCNQFLMSRAMVHKRPLAVWKDLLNIIGVQNACHEGEPDYEHLFHFNQTGRIKFGPEPQHITAYGEHPVKNAGYGRIIQACTLEHVSHVVFGHQPLDMDLPTQTEMCQNFLPNCPGSPCETEQ